MRKTGTVDIPFRYAGYYYDRETDLYYLKTRYYSPDLGRFITKDDIEYSELNDPQTLNFYAYTKNNPIMYVDPDGNMAIIAVYFIPGIGVIALLATGAAILGGITYKAGSWLGQKAKEYYLRAQNNKQIRKRIEGLEKQIQKRKEKIRNNLRSTARNHWEKEIRTWEQEIARLKKRLK